MRVGNPVRCLERTVSISALYRPTVPSYMSLGFILGIEMKISLIIAGFDVPPVAALTVIQSPTAVVFALFQPVLLV